MDAQRCEFLLIGLYFDGMVSAANHNAEKTVWLTDIYPSKAEAEAAGKAWLVSDPIRCGVKNEDLSYNVGWNDPRGVTLTDDNHLCRWSYTVVRMTNHSTIDPQIFSALPLRPEGLT